MHPILSWYRPIRIGASIVIQNCLPRAVYGSDPSFVFSTATSANPREHAMVILSVFWWLHQSGCFLIQLLVSKLCQFSFFPYYVVSLILIFFYHYLFRSLQIYQQWSWLTKMVVLQLQSSLLFGIHLCVQKLSVLYGLWDLYCSGQFYDMMLIMFLLNSRWLAQEPKPLSQKGLGKI